MSKFFLSVGIIFTTSLIILFYYWLKQKLKKKRDNTNLKLIKKKYYTDNREYLKNLISFYLPLLLENKIQWIIIYSKRDPVHKVELTSNMQRNKVILIINDVKEIRKHINSMKQLGISEYQLKHNLIQIEMTPNAKIIRDTLYYIFESIYSMRIFNKYKIVTSSE